MLIAQANRKVAQAQLFVEEFLTLVRDRQGSDFEQWLERVKTTEVKELRQCTHGLERDKAAGLTLSYSTGPGEGHIYPADFLWPKTSRRRA